MLKPLTSGKLWVFSLLKRMALLPRSLRLSSFIFPSSGSSDGLAIPWAYLGEGESLPWLKDLYSPQTEGQLVERLPLFSLKQKLTDLRSQGMLVFLETNRLLHLLTPAGGYKSFPWVEQKVYFASRNYRSRQSYIESVYGRRVRKSGYEYRLTKNLDEVDKFSKLYYAPYMRHRFGSRAFLRTDRELQSCVKKGFLLQVYYQGRWVAGALCRHTKDCVMLDFWGVYPEYDHHLKMGVLSAGYYFLFQWGVSHDMRIINLKHSRPHAEDGVYEHKRRWGSVTEKSLWPHTSIQIYLPPESKQLPPLRRHMVLSGNGFVELGSIKNR
jgi:hypothetical protein